MKLKIIESMLTETLDDIKKYYPNIDDDTFMELIALDPTYTGKDSAGKYGKWLLNLYNKGKISENDFNEITPLLNQFKIYRNRIQNKDLNSYKSLDDLAQVLASVVDDDSMLTPRQKVRFLKNVKSGKVQLDASDDYDVVLDTPRFVVYVPNTHEASMNLGKGTKWCTAHENPDWYDSYTENGHKLYIVKDKKTGKRWQYSDDTGDFLDEDDESFDVPELMKQDAKLSKFFEKILGIDYYNFDGTWIYDGNTIPANVRKYIKKLIISNSVTSISKEAFYHYQNLIDVIIPDSVTEIGIAAFENCTSLTSVTIPNSVMNIGVGAFRYCRSLTNVIIPYGITRIHQFVFCRCVSLINVNIPEGVTNIDYQAFADCTNLTSVTIPNSVTNIEEYAFGWCNKLTIYTDNKYVKRYCSKYDIPVKPLKAKNESLKLKILETYNAKDSFTPINNPDRVAAYWIEPKMVGNVTLNDYMRYEKGQDANIEYMSPTEYLQRCAKDIFHSSWNKVIAPIQRYNAETVTKYAEAMKNGDKFPIPYLDYTTENQEGRHRALAVIEAFGEDSIMPVLVIKPTYPTEEEIRKYAEKRWPTDSEWGTEYVKSKYGKFNNKIESDEIEDLAYEEDEMENIETDNEEIDDIDFDLDSALDNVLSDMSDEEFWNYIRKI